MIYSRLVSLKPPLWPLHSGVRMARVMTTSSGLLEVLASCNRSAAEPEERGLDWIAEVMQQFDLHRRHRVIGR